jgi:5'-3' exonuclease
VSSLSALGRAGKPTDCAIALGGRGLYGAAVPSKTPRPKRAPLLVADAPWLLYRSFFALPKSITGASKRPVNALLGTANALLNAVGACAPRAVAVCFGAEEAPHRVELYSPYHAHRDPMPDALRDQWSRAPALFERFGWTVAVTDELEADDLMFSYARAEADDGGRTLILTADRDLYQAVDDHTSMLELRPKGPPLELDADEVRRRYGVGPELVVDFIALRGDPSDGLPGAPGVGAKTARDLLLEHGSLEGIIAAASNPVRSGLRPRIAAALTDHADELRRFQQVARLVLVPVAPPPDASIDYASAAAAAAEYGMGALSARLERELTA